MIVIGIIVLICIIYGENKDTKKHKEQNPYRNGMDMNDWCMRQSDMIQREEWKKMKL